MASCWHAWHQKKQDMPAQLATHHPQHNAAVAAVLLVVAGGDGWLLHAWGVYTGARSGMQQAASFAPLLPLSASCFSG